MPPFASIWTRFHTSASTRSWFVFSGAAVAPPSRGPSVCAFLFLFLNLVCGSATDPVVDPVGSSCVVTGSTTDPVVLRKGAGWIQLEGSIISKLHAAFGRRATFTMFRDSSVLTPRVTEFGPIPRFRAMLFLLDSHPGAWLIRYIHRNFSWLVRSFL